MIESIRKFITELTATGSSPVADPEADVRLAAAALLFHVVGIDGEEDPVEREKLRALLKDRFDLEDSAARDLIRAAGEADAEAVDLYGFTSVLKQNLDVAGRERIVGMMWRLVFADGEMHEFEDNLVWRVSELLGVPAESRIRLKQSVRDSAD